MCKDAMIRPVVAGALAIVSKKIKKWIKNLEINALVLLLQWPCLLGAGQLLRKVRDT